MTKKKQGAAEEHAAAKREEPRTVNYVVNRPYSAAEAPEIVQARVKKEHDEKDVLDLVVDGPDGNEQTIKEVRRSDRREPGTWFKGKA